MSEVSRRDVLNAGLLVAASSVISNSAIARAQRLMSAEDTTTIRTSGSIAPREHLLFDFGWRFRHGHGSDPARDLDFGLGQSDFSKTGDFHFAKTGYDVTDWRELNLPHDWAIELPFVRDDTGNGDSQLRSHGYKPLGRRYPENSVGWYRREFEIPASDAGRRIWVEFDGAFRDTLLFVNGSFVGRHDHGYTPFRFDITDFLNYGGTNVIVARVDASFGDGWFYEGAGIYRHVWLLKTDAVHLTRWESVVRSEVTNDAATLTLVSQVSNDTAEQVPAVVKWQIMDASGTVVTSAQSSEQLVPAEGSGHFSVNVTVPKPALWSPDTPNLYTALVTVETNATIRDGERIEFGIRLTRFDADEGFFLNGEHLKVKGVCNHQDHAGVGAALPDHLQAFRIGVMQEMGCNAIRTSHNMPTPELIEACDRMGMMVLCETRQLSSSVEGLAQLETMIKRFRNSPAVIMWSIGNEEWQLQKPMAAQGARIAASMVDVCHRLDPTRKVTVADNGDNLQGVADAVDVVGFNYNPPLADKFHEKFPKRPIIHTEISSAIATRGEYVTDPVHNLVNSYDGVVSWGQRPEEWWKWQMERKWSAGGFAWTGFDYRGEPTPYGWPSINSQFGIVDMCGFPKDYFYYYQAWWTNKPVLHLFPHWNWTGKEGKEISVWVYSNLDEVELIVNGKTMGRKVMPQFGHVEWKATYEPGYIEARGFKNGKLVLTERHETTGAPATIQLSADRIKINADGEDIAILKVEVLDSKGRAVPTANNRIAFEVLGAGKLIGVGNGDPNCLESDQASQRSLFNGLAQALVQSSKQPGPIIVQASSHDGSTLKPGRIMINSIPASARLCVA